MSTCAHAHRQSDIFSSILLFLKLLPLGPHYTTSALVYRVEKRGFHAASEQRCNAPCISPLLRVPVLHLGYANDQHLEGHFLCTETHSLVLHSYPNPPPPPWAWAKTFSSPLCLTSSIAPPNTHWRFSPSRLRTTVQSAQGC